jgi:hypothetical protein
MTPERPAKRGWLWGLALAWAVALALGLGAAYVMVTTVSSTVQRHILAQTAGPAQTAGDPQLAPRR